MKADLAKIWQRIKEKKNVIGYSGSLRKRIKNGKEVNGTRVMRVYVSKKEPIEALNPDDVIPQTMNGVEIDVVEIGEIKAQSMEGTASAICGTSASMSRVVAQNEAIQSS